MLGKSQQGLTIRLILWSVFYINIFLFLVAIWVSSDLLLVLCLLISLFIIMLGNKHQEYSAVFDSSSEYTFFKRVSFFSYLKNSLLNKSLKEMKGRDIIRKESIAFSVNSASAQKEYLIHSRNSSVLSPKDLIISIGSSQCRQPYKSGVLNIEIPEIKEIHHGLIRASLSDRFALSTNDYSIIQNDTIDFILKVPVNTELRLDGQSIEELSFQQLFALPSVKAIELYMEKTCSGYYSLPEFIGRKNNTYFHSIPALLNFVLKLREFINGKPIGIKIGIGVENEFRELCKAMKDRNILLDFISIIGDNMEESDKGSINKSLDYALSFALDTLKEFHLENEVRLIAIGKIENGFELLKLLSLGASSCISQFPSQLNESNSVIHEYLDIRKETLDYHRKVLKETLQLMRYAGFNTLKNINPKKFFRQDSNAGIKTFEEIYFKDTNYHTHDLIKNFMYN